MALGVGRRRTPTGGLNPKYVFRAFRKDSWFLILESWPPDPSPGGATSTRGLKSTSSIINALRLES